jgi:hypothetical protein
VREFASAHVVCVCANSIVTGADLPVTEIALFFSCSLSDSVEVT